MKHIFNERIKDAKKILEMNGYYTKNLWHTDDVMQNYECTSEEAQELLDKAMTGEWVIEQIFVVIDECADAMEIKKKINKKI